MKKSSLLKLINYWPPYLGTGIKILNIAEDFRSIDVEMNMRPWNRNYVGTHFGGSLYAMVDPFYMLMLIEILGKEFIVWDKAASIRFKKPGRGKVSAQFRLTEDEIELIKNDALKNEKVEPTFDLKIFDEDGDVVAEVHKVLYVKHKSVK